MTQQSIWECDACGDCFGHKNEIRDVPVRFRSEPWEHPREQTLVTCVRHTPEGFRSALAHIDHFCVGRGEGGHRVVGYQLSTGELVHQGRANPGGEYEAAMNFVEDELLR